MLAEIAQALGALATPLYWGAAVGGMLAAMLLALVPGVSTTLLMALAIPFVVRIDPWEMGIVMLVGVAGVRPLGQVVQAVLFGYPSGEYATFLEGHQLARQGKAAHTLGAAYTAAAFSSLFGVLVLALVILAAGTVVSASEHLTSTSTWLMMPSLFVALTILITSTGTLVKGLAAAGLGMLLSTIGLHEVGGEARVAFGQIDLLDGIPIGVMWLGVITLPELIDLAIARRPVAPEDAVLDTRESLRGAGYALRRWPMLLRQSAFGAVFGIVPNTGFGWLAYALGIAFSKDRGQFGKGSLDGVLFVEGARASGPVTAIPALTLGIPSSRTWAFVIVAALTYGIAPGPGMMEKHLDVLVLIGITFAIGAVATLVVGISISGRLAKLTRIPYPFVGGIFIPMAVFITPASTTVLEPGVALVMLGAFTGLGILMKVFRWPRPPLLLGFLFGETVGIALPFYAVNGGSGANWPLVGALAAVVAAATLAFARSGWHRSRSGISAAPHAQPDEAGDGPNAANSLLLRLNPPKRRGIRVS